MARRLWFFALFVSFGLGATVLAQTPGPGDPREQSRVPPPGSAAPTAPPPAAAPPAAAGPDGGAAATVPPATPPAPDVPPPEDQNDYKLRSLEEQVNELKER